MKKEQKSSCQEKEVNIVTALHLNHLDGIICSS